MRITKANFIKFVGFAGELKTLSHDNCFINGMGFTDDFMLKLVDLLRCTRHAGDTLVLKLDPIFLREITIVENESVLPYLQIWHLHCYFFLRNL